MADLADIAAATAAGYKEVVQDRGANALPRYAVTLEKHLLGGGAVSNVQWRASGEGSSQANAEAQALASLNGMRRARYAGAKDSFGVALTVDVN